MPKYYHDESRQAAGSTSAVTIYLEPNDHERAILVFNCVAQCSGVVSSAGITIFKSRGGRTTPIFHAHAAQVANETCNAPMPFLLLPGEKIGATFDAPAASTNQLYLAADGEYVHLNG